jgi:hypothetical protein
MDLIKEQPFTEIMILSSPVAPITFNMMIRQMLFFIVFLLFSSFKGSCEIIPADNSTINYTNIYFEEQLNKNAGEYELSIYSDSLLIHLITKMENRLPAFWVSDLSWGKRYYWKVTGYSTNRAESYPGQVHRFNILKIIYQSYDEIKIDVGTNKEDKNAGGLISIDYTKSIIDRKGRQVWAIPPLDSVELGKMYIRDMRITKDNTVTFLTFQVPYELDFNGKVIWKAPFPCIINSDTITYHHDFKKTSRGTYMILGEKKVYRKLLGNYTDEQIKNSPDVSLVNNELYKKTMMTILLEFNKEGKIIWYWDANDYIKDIDLNYKLVEAGTPNFATHANAFSENKEGTKVYVGFRDLNRIVKLDKKTKKIELSYGEKYPSGEAMVPINFVNQHDANVSDHNSIYIFNNNGLKNLAGISSIMELRDNLKHIDSAVIWKFNLNFDTLTKGKSVNGGNIVELPNKNLLFCAGALNRIFEVTRDKEIVWDAFLSTRGIKDSTWQPFVQYRANWIKQLNRFHFIPQISSAPIKKGNKCTIKITINNTGNVGDSYEIDVFSKEDVLLFKGQTKFLGVGESLDQTINFKIHTDLEGIKTCVKSNNSSENKLLIN